MKILYTLIVAFSFASPVFSGFQYFVEFDQTSYTAAPGASVTVGLQLREVTTLGDTPRLFVGGADGLGGFDVLMNNATFSGGQSVLPSGGASWAPNAGAFNFASTVFVPNTSLRVQDAASSANGAEIGTAILQLGTFTFLTPNVPVSSTTLTLSPGGSPAFLFMDGFSNTTPGASFSFGSATISVNVSAVPEPSTMLLAALAGTGAGIQRLWRRKRK